ncbi:MAG: hypothetical protein WBY99_02325 [Kaistella sp.]
MKIIIFKKLLLKSLILAFFAILISCSKNDGNFIEFTRGRSMNPNYPRTGIKITNDNYVYYCEEIMNNGENYYLNRHTGKYKFYKSEEKIDFIKYKDLILKNYSTEIKNSYKRIPDATLEMINFKLDNKERVQNFYYSQLNKNKDSLYNEIWKLKKELKFKKTDSILFSQKLLQEKLPKPPSL